jgi:hypothetical protein
MNEQEKWVTIDGFENYEISNMGNVRSLNYHKERRVGPMKLSTRRNNIYVKLTKNKVGYLLSMKKLVAEHFIINDQGYKFVRFISDDFTDVRASNIKWCEKKLINN